MFDIPKSIINSSAKDGDILKLENGIYQINNIETEKQREIIKDLVEKTTKSH